MRLLTWYAQNKIYQHLVEIIKFLAPIDGIEAVDAINDVYRIAFLVGGDRMVHALEGRSDKDN